MGTIVKSEEEFDTIDLDLEDKPKETKTEEEVASLDDIDLDIEDDNPLEVKDEFADEVKDAKPETKSITVETTQAVKKATPSEDLEISLDDEPEVASPKKVNEFHDDPPDEKMEEIVLEDDEVKPPAVEELVAPPVVEPPVKEKKTRAKKAKVETVVESKIEDVMILNPEFELSKISDSKKYQTRAVQRTPQQLEEFGKILKQQGQLEPIHLHKEGEEYFVVVGFGRYEALKSIGQNTVKAIIHENLPESEITKLSTGTNENRLQLSEWDKITSVGIFATKHPDVPKDDENNRHSLTSIFGYSRASIYHYIELHKFFEDKPKLCEFFKHNHLNQFVFKVLFDAKKHIEDDEKFIKFIVDNKDKSKREFEVELSTFVANEAMVKRIVEQESSNPNADIDVGQSTKQTKLEKDIDTLVEKMTGTESESTKVNAENIKKTSEQVTELSKNLGLVEESLKNLLAIDNVKNYIDNSRISSLTKKFQNLNKMYIKLT